MLKEEIVDLCSNAIRTCLTSSDGQHLTGTISEQLVSHLNSILVRVILLCLVPFERLADEGFDVAFLKVENSSVPESMGYERGDNDLNAHGTSWRPLVRLRINPPWYQCCHVI